MLNEEFHWGVEWWLQYLPTWNGVSFLYESHWLSSMECQLFPDASDIGFGCYFQGHWCQDKFTDTHYWRGLCMLTGESCMALPWLWLSGGDHFRGKRILVHCDNTSVVQIMSKCSSMSKSMMVLVHSLVLFGMENNFDLHLQHIPGVKHGIANTL